MKQIFTKKNLVMNFFHLLLLTVAVLLLSGSLGFKRDSPTIKDVEYIETVQIRVNNGSWKEITLPYNVENLPAQTPVSLKATIQPTDEDGVYIKSTYASADVYLDDKLVFTFGKMENYPNFMMDPAIEIHVIETNGTGDDMEVRVEYLSPRTSSTLSLEPLMVGTSKELILERSTKFGFSMALSLAQIIGGAMLLIISLFILFIDKKGIMFFWLGFFSLATGSWFLGSNKAAITLIPDTTWLYLLMFVGLTTFIIPLLEFSKIAIDFTDPKPIWFMELFFAICASTALILQLLGIFPLNRSVNFFRFTLTPALFVLTCLVILEFVRNKNPYARRFIFPSATLSCFAALQLIHDSFFVVDTNLHLFQIGVNIFLLVMGITAGIYVKDSIDLKNKQKELIFEKKLLDMQTAEQRANSLLLAKNEHMLSQQRHNLRHQLIAIQELAGDNEALQNYLSILMEDIPKAKERFCENSMVNAVISHYAFRCERNGVQFSSRLVVPHTGNQSTDSDLCVIFANLLENATEACERMAEGKRVIRLNSTLKNKLLTITMDNSFNGEVTKIGERFRSSKRNDYGIGLASIQAIAEESHGGTDFHAEGNMFFSSIYLIL